MTQAIITKIKNQTITLPKNWKGSRVLLRVTGNNATITKLKTSGNIFSESEIKALRKLGSKINKTVLKKALAKK